MAFLAPIIPALKFAALGFSAYNAISTLTRKDSTPQQPFQRNTQAIKELDTAQTTASDDAADIIRRRRRAGTQTVFTNPLGQEDTADVSRKTLLGE